MISPLAVATDGYLSVTKRVLVIAVAGYLNFGGEVIVVRSDSGFIGVDDETRFTGSRNYDQYAEQEIEQQVILCSIQAFLTCH